MLLLSFAMVTAPSMTSIEEKTKETLAVSRSVFSLLNINEYIRGAVSDEKMYENVYRTSFNVSPKYLQANIFAKKIT